MRKYKRKNSFNKNLGRDLYAIIFFLLLLLCVKIWGANIIISNWFFLIGSVTYFLVGFILRKTGVWKY